MASLVSCGAAASSSSTSSSYLARPLSAARPFCCLRHLHSGLSLHRQGLASQQGSSSLEYAKHGAPFKRGALFSVKAMDVSGPGSIESTLMISMTEKLKEQLNTNDVVVRDAYGDGRHVSIEVVSSDFEGKSSVNRQRMVYKAIWEELQTTVHAVDNMRTWTPEEAAQERSSS